MSGLAAGLLTLSLKGALAAALVGLVVAAGGSRLPPALRHGLWLLVFLRLLVPVAPASPTSLLALSPAEGGVLPGVDAGLLSLRRSGPAAASPGDAGETSAPASWPGIALAVWAAGFTVLGLRDLAAGRRLRRRLGSARPVTDPRVLRLLAEARRSLGVRRPVTLLESRAVGPGVTGVLRPRIVLPRDLIGALDDDGLRHVLLHELAHVRRLDGVVRAAAGLVAAAHWFNPLAWLALRRLSVECEAACDAAVLAHLAGTPEARRSAYGSTLIEVAARPRVEIHPLGASILALSHTRDLKRRVLMIARYQPTSLRAALSCALLFAAVAAVTLTDAPLDAAPAPAEESRIEPAESERILESMKRIREAGTAMFHWVSDAMSGGEWPGEDPGRYDWSACPRATHAQLEALLVPEYVAELPTLDAWGHPLEFCLDRDPKSSDLYLAGIRSPGRDGAFEGTVYEPGAFPVAEDERDLVWLNGYFVSWPSRKAE